MSTVVKYADGLVDTSVFLAFADFVSVNWLTKVNYQALSNTVNNMDPIANFLTQIRNGYLANKSSISVPHSQIKETIANILSQAGYLGTVTIAGQVPRKTLEIELLYHQKQPLLTHISRVSTPSVRRYVSADKIPHALSGKGLVILTTSKGLMTGQQARKLGIGGEIICQVW